MITFVIFNWYGRFNFEIVLDKLGCMTVHVLYSVEISVIGTGHHLNMRQKGHPFTFWTAEKKGVGKD